jgi:predicted outer membrane repeat protein
VIDVGGEAYTLTVSALGLTGATSIPFTLASPADPGSTVILTDTTWTLENSPYTVTGSVLVSGDATLTIEAGVEVGFDARVTLQVNGTLVARGTAADPVVFTSNAASPAAGDWGYILFADSSQDATFDAGGNYAAGSILEHCSVKYAGGVSGSSSDGENNYAIRIDQSAPYIDSCTVSNNAGSGIRVTDIGSANLKIKNSTLSANTSWLPGGGISIYSDSSPSITLSGNTITNNTTTDPLNGVGGGVYMRGSGSSITFSDNTVTGNSSMGSEGRSGSGGGGGIFFEYISLTMSDNTIANNTASNAGGKGGGIFIRTGTIANLSGNSITGNTAGAAGGGIYIRGGNSETHLSNNIVTGNTSSGSGGGIYLDGDMTLSGNVVYGNSATGSGGGLYLRGGKLTATSNLIASNESAYAGGMAVTATKNGTVKIERNTFINNKATATPAYIVSWHGQGTGSGGSTLSNNNFLENDAEYLVYNGLLNTDPDLPAENNWWGTATTSEIADRIYDWAEDSSLGLVDYLPFLTAPPVNVAAQTGPTSISLTWSVNP